MRPCTAGTSSTSAPGKRNSASRGGTEAGSSLASPAASNATDSPPALGCTRTSVRNVPGSSAVATEPRRIVLRLPVRRSTRCAVAPASAVVTCGATRIVGARTRAGSDSRRDLSALLVDLVAGAALANAGRLRHPPSPPPPTATSTEPSRSRQLAHRRSIDVPRKRHPARSSPPSSKSRARPNRCRPAAAIAAATRGRAPSSAPVVRTARSGPTTRSGFAASSSARARDKPLRFRGRHAAHRDARDLDPSWQPRPRVGGDDDRQSDRDQQRGRPENQAVQP